MIRLCARTITRHLSTNLNILGSIETITRVDGQQHRGAKVIAHKHAPRPLPFFLYVGDCPWKHCGSTIKMYTTLGQRHLPDTLLTGPLGNVYWTGAVVPLSYSTGTHGTPDFSYKFSKVPSPAC